jgi:hypothetical protein
MANTWQGEFPRQNLNHDAFERASPLNAFPPKGYGLQDMIGNVREWTADWYSQKHEADAPKARCIPVNPRGAREDASYDPRQPNIKIPRKVNQARLACVRAKLLPPLPPGRTSCRANRYIHQSRRFPMHQADRTNFICNCGGANPEIIVTVGHCRESRRHDKA